MRYICNTTDFCSERPSAVTLGKFDGLHRGHQKLLREVYRLQKDGLYGIVFAIAPDQIPVLLTEEEKRKAVETQGIDCMIRCPFIPEILNMEPERFVAEVLIGQLQAKYVIVGTDFCFGRNRSGDVSLLETLQEKYGFTLIVLEKECYGDREISSTYVREALEVSDMELVQDLLGHPYPVREIVQHGRQLGRKIGMPTINLVPHPNKLLPRPGVYYSDVEIGGRICHGITNIGYKPTVDGSFLGVETYLYHIKGDLYGQEAKVSLRKFCRAEQRFPSVDALKAQMEQDIRAGEEYFSAQ